MIKRLNEWLCKHLGHKPVQCDPIPGRWTHIVQCRRCGLMTAINVIGERPVKINRWGLRVQ